MIQIRIFANTIDEKRNSQGNTDNVCSTVLRCAAKHYVSKLGVFLQGKLLYYTIVYLSISFCPIMRLAKHLTVLDIGSTAFAPCSHMVCVHFAELPYACLVGSV